jgi:serine protease Do
VFLREIDQDLQRSLQLPVDRGALVQDITDGSPASRAGLKPYDVILSFDEADIRSDDALIKAISSRTPGATVRLRLLRDGREQTVSVKLAERPAVSSASGASPPKDPAAVPAASPQGLLGLTVRELDASAFNQLALPKSTRGVLITRVEPMSASFDAELRRNSIILEINRRSVQSVADYRRIADATRPGDVLALYVYLPEVQQRKLVTVRVEGR